ncbi:MAG: response regulator [Thermodesulfobacteriota bacterium]|nr:response regulator [Thermodesulfobacteriota bacterium]
MTAKAEKRLRSLIVDDDATIRDVLSEILMEGGYCVDTAEDGVDALAKVKKDNFDSILCDIWMPGMNGIDLLKEIKKYDPTLPVVMITGYPDVRVAVEAIKEGASDFIAKPVRMEQVEIIIEKLVKERELLLENAKLTKKIENKKTIEELNTKLHKKVRELSTLYSISETFSEVFEGDELFDKIASMACEITEARKSSLMILNGESKELVIKAAKGLDEEIIEATRIPLGSGIAGKVALTGEYVFFNGLDNSPEFEGFGLRYNTDSFISVPLKIKHEVFGVLNVTERVNGNRFTEEELYLLLALAKKGALNIENSVLYESIYNNLIGTLRAMVNAIEARDMYTGGHSQRVTKLAMGIAREMGCLAEEIETIKLGGFLHDIGKVGIGDSILLKPGKLTNNEFDIIKTHPVIGENIVKPLGILPAEKSIIRHHHERWDGKGYPDGLSGGNIPLLARILSVADAFDAMVTDRPYRRAKTEEDSLSELEKLSGFQFDKQVVEKFKKILKKDSKHEILMAIKDINPNSD